MTSHDAELSRNMDRITQLQDGIDNLVTIMYSTISFLSRKADFKQVNPDISITQSIPDHSNAQNTHQTFAQNSQELVQDFIKKAKQIEYLISILPPLNDHPIQPTTSIPSILQNHQLHPSSPSNSHLPPSNHITLHHSPTHSQIKVEHPAIQTDDRKPNQKLDDNNQIHNSEPQTEQDEDDQDQFEKLQSDIHAAQLEYNQALLTAELLHSEIKSALRKILDRRMINLLSKD
ncbi:hypothetical protein O181_111022 [Austropuccinia psidii MF-1]|uniref:Mediator of RNA polymerase II transcription subunit 21 n=1 Tax=Austropuccinia psidii MF-1 TaxID=1389203 RepID=A0A9Q3K0Z7_9BASI|nr:hypothetical protein [Austropuccinia psidii MF-1]